MTICISLVHQVLRVSKYKPNDKDTMPSKYQAVRNLTSWLCRIALPKETTSSAIKRMMVNHKQIILEHNISLVSKSY